jgi:tetratricopeptide (TPR) repeat protein
MKKLLLAFILLISATTLQAQQTAESYLKSAIDKQSSGDNEGAIADCTKALTFGQNVADITNVRAVSLFNLGRYEQAIEDFNRTIRVYPNNALAYNYRGTCRYILGKTDKMDKQQRQVAEALKDFSSAIRISPRYASAYANRGTAKVCVRLYNDAISDFSEAIGIDPGNAAYYNNRAFARSMVGKNTDAVSDCNTALRLDPKIAAGAYRNRGNAEIRLGRYEAAIEDCSKAISLDLQNPKAYNYRGYAYYMAGKYELAIKDDDTSTEYKDDDGTPYWQYRDEAEAKLHKQGGTVSVPTKVIAATHVPANNNPATPASNAPAVNLAPSPVKINTATETAAMTAQSGPEPLKKTESMSSTKVTSASQSSIAPPENNAGNIFVNFQWIKPVDDVTSLPNGILKPFDSNEIPIKIKVTSNVPLDTKEFHLFMNNEDVSNGNKMTTAGIEELKRKANTYQYNYVTTVKVRLDTSVIRLTYKNSASDDLTVVYRPQDISLHILAIGTEGQSLKYPEKDASDFANIFSDQKGAGKLFHDVSAKVLIGDDAKAINMANEIGMWAGKQYNERDVLMLFISSHGLIENGHLVITGSDYKATNSRQTTLDFKGQVVDQLEALNCKKFIFIDACNSGAGLGDGGKAALQDVTGEINKMATSGNGITIISSSSSTEKSWEDESWGNGAFTRAIKDGLQEMKADKDGNGFVTMSELFEYVKIRVADLISQAGKKDENGNAVTQTPKMVNPRGDVSIYIK